MHLSIYYEKYRYGEQIKPGSKFIGKPYLVVDFRSSFETREKKGIIAFNVSFGLDLACKNRTFELENVLM